MLVHSLAAKYARFVVLVRIMYWTPPPHQTIGPPLLKFDDLFLGNQEILDPPPFKNPGHAPVKLANITILDPKKIIIKYIVNINKAT